MNTSDTWRSSPHRTTVLRVVTLCALVLLFDGYDLVVYGTIVPVLLDDPSQLGPISAAQAGALGSYALVGVMVGALVCGAIGDYVGRRRIMIVNIVWFSLGMALTAMATSMTMFGLLRFVTGIGVGGLVATAGAVVAEFAPAGKRNLFNAIVYSGVPAGGVLASILALLLRDEIGWRGLFWVGALPLVLLLPLAVLGLPESPVWLAARGRIDRAAEITNRFDLPPAIPSPVSTADSGRTGFAALATRQYAVPTLLLGIMSFGGLLLTYGLNTWLPVIMAEAGFNAKNSLGFLLVLNGGAIVGGLIASRAADRLGPKPIVTVTFLLAAASLLLLTADLPLGMLFALVAVAGTGTIGTQVLIYGFVSTYYRTSARAAGVAWCAGFGRLGGIGGPLVGGALIGLGLTAAASFSVFAVVALAGAAATLAVPAASRDREPADVAIVPASTT